MKGYVKGSDNVFADLDLSDPDERLAKSDLVRQIDHIISKKRLTQSQVAKILGINQPKVSALLNGKLSGFSMDRLLKFLMALDQDIEIRVKPKSPRIKRRARTTVVSKCVLEKSTR